MNVLTWFGHETRMKTSRKRLSFLVYRAIRQSDVSEKNQKLYKILLLKEITLDLHVHSLRR